MRPQIEQLSASLAADRFGENRTRWAEKLMTEKIDLQELLPILDEEGKVPMYFTWLLGEIVEKAPEMLVPVLPELFERRKQTNIQGYRRSLAKWMYHAGLPAGLEGEALDALFLWARDPAAQVSIVRFALLVLCGVAENYPDLRPELRLVLEEQRDLRTKNFQKQVDGILSKLPRS